LIILSAAGIASATSNSIQISTHLRHFLRKVFPSPGSEDGATAKSVQLEEDVETGPSPAPSFRDGIVQLEAKTTMSAAGMRKKTKPCGGWL